MLSLTLVGNHQDEIFKFSWRCCFSDFRFFGVMSCIGFLTFSLSRQFNAYLLSLLLFCPLPLQLFPLPSKLPFSLNLNFSCFSSFSSSGPLLPFFLLLIVRNLFFALLALCFWLSSKLEICSYHAFNLDFVGWVEELLDFRRSDIVDFFWIPYVVKTLFPRSHPIYVLESTFFFSICRFFICFLQASIFLAEVIGMKLLSGTSFNHSSCHTLGLPFWNIYFFKKWGALWYSPHSVNASQHSNSRFQRS